jgi:nanoRNase/pAp phosphatase (c-di-AMP/oligoRNAs hydrolase)
MKNDADIKAKQQIIDKIKSSTNILVTVSRDPSVDDLSAMLGLAAILNKLGKHATAIFSGAIPPAITFLEPNKVIENTANSLRDFIIALDKEKADHLRYKVDGDVVKIFITPYRTNITVDDLEFSQGDYNIELVLALGVANQEHLDAALTAQGSVLDNVTIVTLSAGQQSSQLGNVDWNDKNASSLSEMIASIGEAFKSDKPLLDKQIATALLTGIVAATDRFSNIHTSPQVMTVAAQLMAAGADQQLIAARLQESHEIHSLTDSSISKKPEAPAVPAELVMEQSTLPPSDNLVVRHDSDTPTPEPVESPVVRPELSNPAVSTLPPEVPIQAVSNGLPPETAIEPSMGGTLNATADQAADDVRRELEDQQNKTILTHSYLSDSPNGNTPINSTTQSEDDKVVDIFANAPLASRSTVPDLAITTPPTPLVQPPRLDMPMPPPLPDFSTLPPPPVVGFDTAATNNQPAYFNVSQPTSTSNDPAQFRIPGQ